MNETQIGTSTPGQSWPGSNGNKGVLHTPKIYLKLSYNLTLHTII